CPKTNIWSSKILINKLAQIKRLKSLLLLIFFLVVSFYTSCFVCRSGFFKLATNSLIHATYFVYYPKLGCLYECFVRFCVKQINPNYSKNQKLKMGFVNYFKNNFEVNFWIF